MVTTATIFHKYRDAVVTINNATIYFNRYTEGTIVSTPFGRNGSLSQGYLIKENYIVAALSDISFATVYLPDGTIYYTSNTDETAVGAPIPENAKNRINFFDFTVTVWNVNGSDCNVRYKPRVVGIDSLLNIAVLRIDDLDAANQGIIPLTCEHPYFEWGNSQDLCYGTEVYLFSKLLTGFTNVSKFEVSAPLQIVGSLEFFNVDISRSTPGSLTGSVVIDSHGKIVGARYFLDDSITTAGSYPGLINTQHQLQSSVDTIISGLHGPLGCHLTQTSLTNLGYPINVYVHAWIGYRYVLGQDYNSLRQNTGYLRSQDFINVQDIPGNICSLIYCDSNYCLGTSKRHYLPIQITYKAVPGDVALLNGINNEIPYQRPVIFQAPKDQIVLFVPLSPGYATLWDGLVGADYITYVTNIVLVSNYV